MSSSEDQKPVCVVTGVGPGNGLAISARMAAEGHQVAMLARRKEPLLKLAAQVPGALPLAVDVTDDAALKAAFAEIREKLGPVSVLVHNAGSGHFSGFMDLDANDFEQAWSTNTRALLIAGQEAARDMLELGGGSIVVIGATASLRGGAGTGSFASAKAGQRSLAQTMAKALGPQGIHVSYVIVDGVIDIPRTREMLPDRPDEFFLEAPAIADSVHHLVTQPRSAWTFELDLRPFGEKW